MPCNRVHLTLPAATHADPFLRADAFAAHHANRVASTGAAATRFDFPTQLVDTTPDGLVTVYVDPALGQRGTDLATQFLAAVPAAVARCAAWFGTPMQPVICIIASFQGETDGTGGAYHYGCDFASGGDIYLSFAAGNVPMEIGLFVAELTECFMADGARGWGCGASSGEGLSRVLAEQASGGPGGALGAFATGPTWFGAGMPNWVDATEPTDGDDVATGCCVAYLYWMASLGYTFAQIVQAGCLDGSLASNYTALTGKSTAWADFSAAVGALPGGVTGDDPWMGIPPVPAPPAPVPPAPPPTPAPPPVPRPPAPSPAPPSGPQVVTVDVAAKVVVMPPGWTSAIA